MLARLAAVFLAIVVSGALSHSAFASTMTWDNGASKAKDKNKWGTGGKEKKNWNPDVNPMSTDDIAIFGGAGDSGIELKKDLSIGEIHFDSATTGYDISGSKTLTFDVSSGSAAVNVLSSNAASHELGMSMLLSDDLVIDHQGSGDLTLSGEISGAGRDVTVQGSGSTVMSGSNSYDGTTTVTGGTLSLGADNVFADSSSVVVDGGTFDIGTRSDTLGSVTLQSGNLSGTGSLVVDSLVLGPGISDIDVEVTFATPGTSDLTLDSGTTDVVTVRKKVKHHGRTKVKKGKLKLRGQGSVADSSTIEISSGAVLDVSETDSGGITLESGQVLSGSGTVLGDLIVASGSQLSPGNSPGILMTGNQTWEGGGSLLLEMDDGDAGAGVGWDLLDITGTLSITATLLDQFEIDLTSLLEGTDTSGDASDFPPEPPGSPGSWVIVQTTGGITGFSADAFNLDTSAFTNFHYASFFSLAVVGNNLVLTYIPEPGTGVLLAFGIVMLGLHRKRAPGAR